MKKHFAFSLIELSIVILIIGVLIAGVTQGSRLVIKARLQNAQNLTTNSPAASIANLILWYETSLDTSLNYAEREDNTQISSWYDNNLQGLVKNNATQATSANQPKYMNNIFNNAIPAIRFDGTNDLMSFDGSVLAKSDYSIFIVEQRRAAGISSILPLIGGTGGTQHTNLHIIYNNDTTFRVGHFGYDNDYTITAYSSPVPRIHTAAFSTALGQKYWLNGGSTADSSVVGNTTSLTSNVGAAIGRLFNGITTFYYNGDIAEIIIYNRHLKNEERQAVESYLSQKYSIKII